MQILDEVCILITDGTHYSPKDEGNGLPFVTVKDMSESGLDFDNCIQISEQVWQKADDGNSAPKSGDVLLSKDGTVGKVHVVKNEGKFAALSSIAILRPNPEILDSDYLGHFLKSEDAMRQASRMKTGTALRRIILKDIKRIQLRIPSLDEQKRIATILDKTDVIKTQSEQSILLRQQLIYSLFLDMFGDPRIPVSGKKISEYAHVESGNGFPLKYQGETDNEIPFYKVSDMNLSGNEKYMLFHNNSVTTETVEKLKLRIFPAGSVIFPKIGAAIATNKKRITTVPCCVDNNVIGIIPNLSIDSEYLHTLLQFKDISEFASSSSPPSMRKTTVESWIIPNVEFEKQIEFKRVLQQTEKNKSPTLEFETLKDSLTQEILV